jgi:drug/metabolite transporter (DMT)-like permease
MSHPEENNQLQNKPLAGSLLVLAAALVLSILGALVKEASQSAPKEIIVFFRNFAALICFMPWLLQPGHRKALKTRHFRLHLVRSVAGLLAMYCYFYTLGKMQLAEAVLLTFTSPLLIPIIARIWLKEPVETRTRFAIAIGFFGIALILKPGLEVFQPAALVGLVSALFVALAMVSIRRMSASEPTVRIVFYFTLLACVMSSFPLTWAWQQPSASTLLMLGLIGVIAVFAQLLLTKGYSLAPAGQVGVFGYANVVFAAFIGWFFWNETLDWLSIVGAVFICLAGIMASYRSGPGPVAPGTLHQSVGEK